MPHGSRKGEEKIPSNQTDSDYRNSSESFETLSENPYLLRIIDYRLMTFYSNDLQASSSPAVDVGSSTCYKRDSIGLIEVVVSPLTHYRLTSKQIKLPHTSQNDKHIPGFLLKEPTRTNHIFLSNDFLGVEDLILC